MECWTQTISNSRISVFRGWMRFLTPGVAIVLSLNEPRARRTSFSCGMHSWPWKRWYPTTWRWGPNTHLWDLTARTWRGPFSVTAALGSSLLTKRGGTGLPLRKRFCAHLILSLLKVDECEIRLWTWIPYNRFLFLRAKHSMSFTSTQADFPRFWR